MMSIIPVSISFLSQISLLSTVLTLINMGITFILGIKKRIEELETENNENGRGHFRLPENIEKFKNLDHSKYANKFFISFVIVIVIYFLLIIINTLNLDFNLVEKVIINYKNGNLLVDVIFKTQNTTKIISAFSRFWIVVGTILSWVQLIVIIYVYYRIISVMRCYIKALIN